MGNPRRSQPTRKTEWIGDAALAMFVRKVLIRKYPEHTIAELDRFVIEHVKNKHLKMKAHTMGFRSAEDVETYIGQLAEKEDWKAIETMAEFIIGEIKDVPKEWQSKPMISAHGTLVPASRYPQIKSRKKHIRQFTTGWPDQPKGGERGVHGLGYVKFIEEEDAPANPPTWEMP